MATLQNIGKLKYRGKDGQWHPLPVVVQDTGGGVSTISGKGAPTSETQGEVNQLYRDEDTQKLYICTATDGGGYTWAEVSGGSVDVDATLTKAGYAADAKAAGDAIGKKIDKAQGTGNAGKILGIGADGNLTPQDKPAQALCGPAAPTTATAGVVGQEYYVIIGNAVTEMYVCTAVANGTYTWGKVEFGAEIDDTSTEPNKVWSAKKCNQLSEEIANIPGGGSGLTTAEKTAMLALFKAAAYTSDVSATITQLETIWNGSGDSGGETDVTLTSISATYSGGDVAAGTALSDLTGIVVTATYSDGSTATVTGYTLSGEIAEGSNTITVTYQGKSATIIVTGTAVAQTYTVTNNLTNVTNSNNATTASGYYSATLSAEEGYNINVTITMGGVDITADVYTEDGTILITEVTGDIVITATAELSSAYTVLYQLADTPKSVSGLSEDTGITFGAEDANGYTKALTICVAYTGFDANETLMKMSSGRAIEVITNAGGSNTQIRVTSCSNAIMVNPEISDSGDYRVIITKEATSIKTLNIHTLSSGAVATLENVGTYGNFSHSVCAGNLIVGDSDITVNKLVIYEGILSDAHIATFLSGGEV